MAFGGFDQKGGSGPMAEINMVPLIDVMLVLLVIFMITAPLLTNAVKVDLPTASSTAMKPADKIDLSINGEGKIFWNAVPVSKEEVLVKLKEQAVKAPDTELHLYVDKGTRYELLAEVMSEAANAGLTKIGFVTQPGAVQTAP